MLLVSKTVFITFLVKALLKFAHHRTFGDLPVRLHEKRSTSSRLFDPQRGLFELFTVNEIAMLLLSFCLLCSVKDHTHGLQFSSLVPARIGRVAPAPLETKSVFRVKAKLIPLILHVVLGEVYNSLYL